MMVRNCFSKLCIWFKAASLYKLKMSSLISVTFPPNATKNMNHLSIKKRKKKELDSECVSVFRLSFYGHSKWNGALPAGEKS